MSQIQEVFFSVVSRLRFVNKASYCAIAHSIDKLLHASTTTGFAQTLAFGDWLCK
jgi:hypothetical protein